MEKYKYLMMASILILNCFLMGCTEETNNADTNGNNEETHGTGEYQTFEYNTKIYTDFNNIEITDFDIKLKIRCPGINDGYGLEYDGFASDKIPDKELLKSEYDKCGDDYYCHENLYVQYWFIYSAKNLMDESIDTVYIDEVRFYDEDGNFLCTSNNYYNEIPLLAPRETRESWHVHEYHPDDILGSYLENRYFYDYHHCEIDIIVEYF